MARIRTIKPEFWQDEKVGRLSLPARLMFIGMWNFADDNGVVRGNPVFLRSQIFPYDDMVKSDIEQWLSEISGQGMISIFCVNDEKYIQINNFLKHQVINRPSKTLNPQQKKYVNSNCDDGLSEDSVNTHGTLTESSLTEREREREKEKERIGYYVPIGTLSGKPDAEPEKPENLEPENFPETASSLTNCQNSPENKTPDVEPQDYYSLTDAVTDDQIPDKNNLPDEESKTDDDTSCEIEKEGGNGAIPYGQIIAHLNIRTGKHFKENNKNTKRLIKTRWLQGFCLADFVAVIDTKTTKWRGDPKMADYLRPETLFGNKFEGYLNEISTKPAIKIVSDCTQKNLYTICGWANMEDSCEKQAIVR